MGIITLSPYYMNLFKATMHRVVFVPVWLIATYTNLYFLWPKLWEKGKRIGYAFSISALLFFLTYVQRVFCIQYIYPKYFWMREPNADELNPFWTQAFIQFAGFIALPVLLSIGIYKAWKWYEESYRSKQLIAEQKEAELNYLKAQVNPHFLFNTLNNLYGLSLESSKKVPDLILKLSELLSYSLYESNKASVSLEKELGLVRQYLSLEQARFEEQLEVRIQLDENIDQSMHIAPLLILPLVENAIKHGYHGNKDGRQIDITLIHAANKLNIRIENPFPEREKEKNKQTGGMGLQNLRRRLELHYPNKHQLEINEANNHFTVALQIEIDD